MFVTVWTTHGKSVTEELKQRSLSPKQVTICSFSFCGNGFIENKGASFTAVADSEVLLSL